MSTLELLELTKSLTDNSDRQGRKIIGYLEKKLHAARAGYVDSDPFKTQVSLAMKHITQHPEKKFKYISEILRLLKSNKEFKANESDRKVSQSSNGDVDEAGPVTDKKMRSIQRLEALMQSYCKEIKKYEEKELTVEEMDSIDTAYLTTERLKKRCFKIHQKICKLGEYDPNNLGGLRQRNVQYNGTRYKELNYHITKMLNRSSDSEERMPDYQDVIKIVKKCNTKYSYSLSPNKIRDLAKEIFIKIGSDIQNLRKNDFVSDFGHTDSINTLLRQNTGFEDPALIDAVLRRKLEENRKAGDANLTKIFEQYARQQEDGVEVKSGAGPSATATNVDEEDSGSESGETESSVEEEMMEELAENTEDELPVEANDVSTEPASVVDNSGCELNNSSHSSESSKEEESENVELSSLDEESEDDSEGEDIVEPDGYSDPSASSVPQPEVIELSDSD